MEQKAEIKQYVKENTPLLERLLKELCLIPAPSHAEEKRAEFCKNWLEANGAKGVVIDEAKNVLFPYQCDGSNAITVIEAHTDTVFPDLEPMPYEERDGKIFCPGVGDDTACLAVLLITAKFFLEKKPKTKNGILFVCNSCEEGLGNLKGTRRIFQDFEGRIAEFFTIDGELPNLVTSCVGSHRYEVTVTTEGGHSFLNFGNHNAIAEAAKMINEIYSLTVPKNGDSTTTYNVGLVEGGTSVNTIAQKASFFCEYRSDDRECLAAMKHKFEEIFQKHNLGTVGIEVRLVGDRPCMGDVDQSAQEALIQQCKAIFEPLIGQKLIMETGSTDCNIPLSLGIPAVCIGAYCGGGAHTREEWLVKDSLPIGLEASILLLLSHVCL